MKGKENSSEQKKWLINVWNDAHSVKNFKTQKLKQSGIFYQISQSE